MPLPNADLRKETDEDLLVYMGWQGEDPELAKEACGEFYTRHVRYVYAVIRDAHGNSLGSHGVEDMVSDTFTRVMEKAASYKPCGSKDRDVQRRNALAWIGTIASHLCMDHFRKPGTKLVLVDDWVEVGEPDSRRESDAGPHAPSEDLKFMRKAWKVLEERERSVLRITMEYWQFGRPHQRLPNEVAADLARTLDTTPENIRKIRERALKKIKSFVESARKDAAGDAP